MVAFFSFCWGNNAVHFKFYLPFLRRGFVKDVIHSNHLGKNGAIAERVAQCSQPGGEITQCHHNLLVGGWDDKEICIHVQDDGPTPYRVVQVAAAQTYQPAGRRTQTMWQYYTLYYCMINVPFLPVLKMVANYTHRVKCLATQFLVLAASTCETDIMLLCV